MPSDYVPHLNELLSQGRRSEAVEYYLEDAIRLPSEMLAQMKSSPMWPQLEAVAHTIPYDVLIMGETMRGNPATLVKWAGVSAPTLVLVGGASPTFFHTGTQALAEILPSAQHRTLPGQTHGPADNMLAPALQAFFLS